MFDIKTQILYRILVVGSESIKEMIVDHKRMFNNGVEIITTGIVRLGRRFDENFMGIENINKQKRG